MTDDAPDGSADPDVTPGSDAVGSDERSRSADGSAREITHDHADVRYLAAKRSVDDRCLSPGVREAVVESVVAGPSVYDAGAGTAVWLPRLVSWGVTPGRYHAVDEDAGLVAYAERARADELAARGIDVDREPDGGFRAGNTNVRFTVGDALANAPEDGVDLVVASSFLDLVSVGEALDRFAAATREGGVVYAPATFDGGTFFAPTHRADRVVERLYHANIERTPGRTVAAGRTALGEIRNRPGELLAVGSSDWVVRPETPIVTDETATDETTVTDGTTTDEPAVTGESTATDGTTVTDETTAKESTATDEQTTSGSDGDERPGETVVPAEDTPAGYPDDEAYFLDRILGYVADTLLERDVTRLSATDPTNATLSAFARERAPDERDAIRDWLTTRKETFQRGELVYVAHQLDVLYRP
ncbi:MAG: class I SAM-dependent methyltransferase [Halobaculum sp.]